MLFPKEPFTEVNIFKQFIQLKQNSQTKSEVRVHSTKICMLQWQGQLFLDLTHNLYKLILKSKTTCSEIGSAKKNICYIWLFIILLIMLCSILIVFCLLYSCMHSFVLCFLTSLMSSLSWLVGNTKLCIMSWV